MTTLSRRRAMQFGLTGLTSLMIRNLPLWSESGRSIVARESWARIDELAQGVWAVVSTPLETNDWTTGGNGALVAGKKRVLAVDAYVKPEGASWVAKMARELVGQAPTDVLVTHFHADHCGGLAGFATDAAPRIWMTEVTRDLILEDDGSDDKKALARGASILDESESTTIDLGGLEVRAVPRAGHTPSDVTLELDEPSIVVAGDLVWNAFFPNYRDTIPSRFSKSLGALRRKRATTYVSGHGELAGGAIVDSLLDVIDDLGEAAQRAHAAGLPVAAAASAYELPESARSWVMFRETYIEVAMTAWYRELGPSA